MEYQNIIILLDDATNQPSKFRTRNWVQVKDESQELNTLNLKLQW